MRLNTSTRIAGVAVGALLSLAASSARTEIISGMPDVIVCSVQDPTGVLPWERMVFYVSAYMRDGRTLYKSSTSDPVLLMVSADGVVDGANLADCDGRSIESLRKDNKAFTFTTGKPGG